MSPRPDGVPPQPGLMPGAAGQIETSGVPPKRAGSLLSVVVWLISLAVLALLIGGAWQFVQGRKLAREKAALLTGGDPVAGQTTLKALSCGGCHDIPGVPGAEGLVGPPLTKFALRVTIAGKYPNTPDNLRLWLQHPQIMDPGIDMPETGASDRQARDMAAYLYTLK